MDGPDRFCFYVILAWLDARKRLFGFPMQLCAVICWRRDSGFEAVSVCLSEYRGLYETESINT
jgi:hypothetical protein